ncbi:MAG TPA: ATP-binding protein [Terriglobales bacterium]|nr:ATP-binding protein [Terriglobales bacterium]
MIRVRDYSIRKKLTWMSMLTSGTALVLASTAFLAYEWTAFRKEILARVSTQAQIVGSNSAAALLFRDPRSAEQTLAALKAEPEIRAAAIYTREGRLFAFYGRQGRDPESSLPGELGLRADRHSFEGGRLVLFRQIVEQGEVLGTVFIQSDLQGMDQRVKRYSAILLLVLGVSFLAALFISSRLQPLIARPMLQLAETARVVSQGRNYSVRAQPGNRDEVGLLIETFNQMLAQIEERDAELQEARAELENRVVERTAELAASNRELESFSYSVAHDLRAPLRHIDGFARILQEGWASGLEPEARRCLERIGEASRHMGHLIDDLLNLSRVGRRELNRQVTSLKNLAGEAVAELRTQTDDRDVEWRIADLPFADCDPNLMKQVFANLLSNSLKYTRPRARAVIEVGQKQDGDETVLFVRDNGVGFNMKFADKLFGVFQRLHRQEDFEGTGVGLATVRRILDKHGGRIWAEAEVDRGATFYFTAGPTGEAASRPLSEEAVCEDTR